jgi:hypothetical protein
MTILRKRYRDQRRRDTTYIKGIWSRNKINFLCLSLYEKCPTKDELVTLGRARAKRGMFEGFN